jgi:hypothetical protein
MLSFPEIANPSCFYEGLIFNGLRREISFETPGQQHPSLDPHAKDETYYWWKSFSIDDLLETNDNKFSWMRRYLVYRRARDNNINQATHGGDS